MVTSKITSNELSDKIEGKKIFYIKNKFNIAARRVVHILNHEYGGDLDHEDMKESDYFGLNQDHEFYFCKFDDIDPEYPIYTPEEFLEAYIGGDYHNFRPVTGESVYVWDEEESDCEEHIFIADLGNSQDTYPIICVEPNYEDEFYKGIFYDTTRFRFMGRIAGRTYKCDSREKKSNTYDSIRNYETAKELVKGDSVKSNGYTGSKYSDLKNRRRIIG